MSTKMLQVKNKLYAAFQEDHAVLGRSLYDLRILIQKGDVAAIRDLANEIIEVSGAHIAFEEFEFYPALRSHLTEKEVVNMYLEHAEGLQLLQQLSGLEDNQLSSDDFSKHVFSSLDVLDHHVADCGNLFGAMGGLADTDYIHLMEKLAYWRELSPSWSEISDLSKIEETIGDA